MEYIIDSAYVGQRLDKVLSLLNDEYTRSYIQKLLEDGNITVNECIVKPSYKVKLGDKIIVNDIETKELNVLPENIKLDIVYEDADVIIINKPKGMVVHPGNGNYEGTLVNALMYSHNAHHVVILANHLGRSDFVCISLFTDFGYIIDKIE